MIVRISSLALLICASPALAQDLDPSVENADTAFFDFWAGTWIEEKDGVADTAGTRFEVTPSVHPGVRGAVAARPRRRPGAPLDRAPRLG